MCHVVGVWVIGGVGVWVVRHCLISVTGVIAILMILLCLRLKWGYIGVCMGMGRGIGEVWGNTELDVAF
jgi:hypothetical protein